MICPECDGSGIVWNEKYKEETPCYICDGSGEVPYEDFEDTESLGQSG